jgi:predicted metal-dependent phosphoesterase TrpH
MDKLIDLHTHTTYSDGEFTPQEVVKMAKEKNIEYLSITDHNSIRGLRTVDSSDIISGIELTAHVKKGKMHILGYDFDIDNSDLNNKLNELRDNSLNNVLTIIELIKKDNNIVFGYDDIKDMINCDHNLNRVDVARLCVKNGFACNIQEAFIRYLESAFEKTRGRNRSLTYDEIIELINKSGGIPVLAHPKSLELSEIELLKLIKILVSCGLKGIEVYHSSHSKEEMELYLRIANEFNLLISGGSDFHGPTVKPDIFLGSGKGNLNIRSLSLVDEINRRNSR